MFNFQCFTNQMRIKLPYRRLGLILGRNYSSDYTSSASSELQSAHSAVQPERSLYNENEVRQELQTYKGGAVLLEKNNETGMAQITLDNAKSRNAISGEMMVQLADHVKELEQWPQGRLLTICGANETFCSGGHLPFVVATATPAQGAKMSIFMQTIVSRIHRLPFITCSFIDGYALGGGAELASITDWRVMTERAKIGFVQSTLGLSTGWGGATHLSKVVVRRHMLRLLTEGKILSANEAFNIGLSDHVVPNRHDYDEWTNAIVHPAGVDPDTAASAAPVRAAKRCVLISEECDYSESLNRERDVFVELWGSPQHRRLLDKLVKRIKKE